MMGADDGFAERFDRVCVFARPDVNERAGRFRRIVQVLARLDGADRASGE
jgi:hypothetical protein